MSTYTTLGDGKSVKLLAVADHHPARTVTTCSPQAAKTLTWALRGTARQMANALFPVAVDADGTPVEVRRRLLSVYDRTVDGHDTASSEPWDAADALVVRVARAVAEEPDAVRAAVRRELDDHLAGFDGVLVAATITNDGYKRAKLDVAASQALDAEPDTFWEYLTGKGAIYPHDDDPLFPLGGDIIHTTEDFELLTSLWETEPSTVDLDQSSVEEIVALADTDVPELNMRADHFLAWVAHHRPRFLDAVRAAFDDS